jgi:four helix bundle protein
MPVFLHEKLSVYQKALDFSVYADEIACRLPQNRWYLKDQLWRAASSMPFNIAEGTGGHGRPTMLYHLRVARGSAAECSAIFDYIERLRLLGGERLSRELLNEVGVLLGTQIFSHLKKQKP